MLSGLLDICDPDKSHNKVHKNVHIYVNTCEIFFDIRLYMQIADTRLHYRVQWRLSNRK